MSVCYLENDKLVVGEMNCDLEDLFTVGFYEFSNSVADTYYTGEIYDNVLFLNWIQKVLSIEYFFEKNSVDRVEVIDPKSSISCYFKDAAKKRNLFNAKPSLMLLQKIYIECKMLAAMLFLISKQFGRRCRKIELDYKKDFAVLRTKAAKEKIKPSDSRQLLYEDSIGVGSFYSFFSVGTRVYGAINGWIEARRAIKSVETNMKKWGFEFSIISSLDFFSYRLVAAKFYQNLIGKLFDLPWDSHFISGNNLDMYAIAEEIEAKKRGISTICIPHGIEYGFRLPHCFTGDVFYTLSKKASEHLNSLYKTNKFVFDQEIVESMFKVKTMKRVPERRIVFFSEPREPEINVKIVKGLLDYLGDTKLYIKHHPKDNLSDYAEFDGIIEIIPDLSEAIQGNICLARKSTTLLEGIYNKSLCGAIIINEKDKANFLNFPSLQDDAIKVFDSIERAAIWAKKLVES